MILFITILFITQTVVSQKLTSCPAIFSYEQKESGSDRWYGKLHYTAIDNTTGIWLQIILDRPADILGNWFGQLTTCDNTGFVIRKPGYELNVGQDFSLRFFVKFNLAKPIPSVTAIKLNGNDICVGKKKESDVGPSYDSEVGKNAIKLISINSDSPGLTTAVSNNEASGDEVKFSCGISASRAAPLIYQGQETTPGQWPWHAALYHHGVSEIVYACGATLITRQHILTAAHCVSDIGTKTIKDGGDISIGLGKYNLKTFEENFQHVGVSDIYIHPKYDPWKLYNDIAVLKLSSPVEVTEYVRPCCLSDEDSSFANIIGKEGTVVGWGINENASHRLMQAVMPVVSTRDCIFSKKEFREFLNENNFCAGYRSGTATCRGDSGGGMVLPKKDAAGKTVWHIRGIVSLSLVPEKKQTCDTSNYNIFTDVAKFNGWIKNVIQNS